MTCCIAFLRAVNVGGRMVKMQALRGAFESIGLQEVQTFIASGNVIFRTQARDLDALERKLETVLRATFGFEIHAFVRTVTELAALVAHPAFDAAAVAAAQTHVVGFLSEAPGATAVATLARLASAADRFQFHGREFYWLSIEKQSVSRFSNAVFERTLKMRTTFRGMGTLRKVLEKINGV